MGEPMRWRLKVRHYEADAYGHVNHANYVHYLETARIEALESVGLSLQEMRRQGIVAVAVGVSVTYHAPANPGETLEIVTHVRDIRGARTLWVQEVREAAGRRLIVTAEIIGAFLTEAGKPVRVPEMFQERLGALYVPDGDPAISAPATPWPRRERRRAPAAPGAAVDTASHYGRSWCVCRRVVRQAIEHFGAGLRKA
jgi:acyl-CoA thioester hydrolase